jgi:hypothetical protein
MSPTDVRVGARVRCERDAPTTRTWALYAGRVGVVVTVNRQQFDTGAPDHVEYGVDFNGSGKAGAWFLPTELVAAAMGYTAQTPQLDLSGAIAFPARTHRVS